VHANRLLSRQVVAKVVAVSPDITSGDTAVAPELASIGTPCRRPRPLCPVPSRRSRQRWRANRGVLQHTSGGGSVKHQFRVAKSVHHEAKNLKT
jgi:hypothetical protein